MPPSVTPIILTATACPAKESPVSTYTDKLNDPLAYEVAASQQYIRDEGKNNNAPPAAGGALQERPAPG